MSIALATGCFDILHVGHVAFLREAAAQADLLFVGVNSDVSLHALKGDARPIVREAERLRLIISLRGVDFAFLYDDTVADEAIRCLRPDVFVAGAVGAADYPSELEAAASVGARVHLVERMEGHSTSGILLRAQGRR